jgi:flagellar motor switch protein FliG
MAVAMDTTTRAGARKAAILLVALGGDLAAPLLRNLRDDQIEAITREIVQLEEVSEQERAQVLAACAQGAYGGGASPAGAAMAHELLARALGSQRATEIVARVTPRDEPFGFVKQTDLSQIITYFEHEHPQTVALALAHMPHHLAGQILGGLDGEIQTDVAQRIAYMARTDPEIVKGVEETMRRQLAFCTTENSRSVGGMEYLVGVLAATDTRTEQAILEGIADADPDLARDLRERMFTFEDVAVLDDRSIQRLLREVDSRDLAVALRGSSEEVRARVFRNMSVRAGQALVEDIERLGPVRLRLVEEAQAKIVDTARRLQEAEEIVIPRGRQDVFI